MAKISLKNIVVGYRKKGIHKPFSVDINEGEVVVIAGRNGSGKSTLIKTLSGLLSPVSGEVLLNEQRLASMPISERATFLSLVQTSAHFWTGLSVQEVLELGAEVNEQKASLERIQQLASFFGIDHVLKSSLTEISDGERQKTMILRAILQNASTIILDEPTAFLDFPSKMKWWEFAKQLKEEGKTLIISSHDLSSLSSLSIIDHFWMVGESEITSHQGNLSLPELKGLLN
ncbi:MAG: ABC transporter ATP-binding protein [Flavobacteriales bacterium]|nr:ABC transporter ATP-binding protein [Flavobacteriales bacterium]MDG1780621.1 ABC transporter ATP-binding protein [Flavobacteriales bacterium]MDG2244962.1 ABC transporter ATP-binding protein [Flavobacteriales bacterium]